MSDQLQYITSTPYFKFVENHVKFYDKSLKYQSISDRDYKKLQELIGFADFCNNLGKQPIIQITNTAGKNVVQLADFLQKKHTFNNAVITVFRTHLKIDLIFLFIDFSDAHFLHKDNVFWGKNKKI